jgi:hypothetical protein
LGCIEKLKYEIVLSQCSFKEARDFVKRNFKELYEVPPGYKIFDVFVIGVPPIYIGIDGDRVVFPYTKPCYGTFLLRIESKEEVERLRAKG